jgi:hypothetical protein
MRLRDKLSVIGLMGAGLIGGICIILPIDRQDDTAFIIVAVIFSMAYIGWAVWVLVDRA